MTRRLYVIGFITASAIFALRQTSHGDSNMSQQTPIARITYMQDESFQVEMMPAEPQPRLIKKGDPLYPAYKAAYAEMTPGDRIHVTSLPKAAKPATEQTGLAVIEKDLPNTIGIHLDHPRAPTINIDMLDPDYPYYKKLLKGLAVGHSVAIPSMKAFNAQLDGLRPPRPQPSGPMPANIGVATMKPDGVIEMMLRSEDHGMIAEMMKIVKPTDADYQSTIDHLGGLKKGESKPIPPYP